MDEEVKVDFDAFISKYNKLKIKEDRGSKLPDETIKVADELSLTKDNEHFQRGLEILKTRYSQHPQQQQTACDSAFMLGWLCLRVLRDKAKAIKFFESAAEGGVLEAITQLAVFHSIVSEKTGVDKDPAKAANYYLRAAELSEDKTDKLSWLTKAAQQGDWTAIIKLSEFYDEGAEGDEELDENSLKVFQSHAGHPFAQFQLARFHWRGCGGLERNLKTAAELMEKLLDESEKEHDDDDVSNDKRLDKRKLWYTLSKIYEEEGEEGDEETNNDKSFEYLSKAAEGGYAPALLDMGEIYFSGWHTIEEDKSKAALYYQRCIDIEGDGDEELLENAISYLADMYIYGDGVEMDDKKAQELLWRIVYKDTQSTSVLGWLILTGRGTDVDKKEEQPIPDPTNRNNPADLLPTKNVRLRGMELCHWAAMATDATKESQFIVAMESGHENRDDIPEPIKSMGFVLPCDHAKTFQYFGLVAKQHPVGGARQQAQGLLEEWREKLKLPNQFYECSYEEDEEERETEKEEDNESEKEEGSEEEEEEEKNE